MKVYYAPAPAAPGQAGILPSKQRSAAGSLFDRLIAGEEGGPLNAPQAAVDGIIRSVRRNLTRALNVHAGSAPSNPELGVPDFNYSTVNTREVSAHLVEAVRRCIIMAEPRLGEVAVRSSADADAPLELRFAITGTLKVSHEDDLVRINLAMRNGHFYPM